MKNCLFRQLRLAALPGTGGCNWGLFCLSLSVAQGEAYLRLWAWLLSGASAARFMRGRNC